MNIRELAEADLAVTLTDTAEGTAREFTLKNPAGATLTVSGTFGDIGMIINPETGQPVMSRKVHLALRLSDVSTLGIPDAENDPKKKPWTALVQSYDGAPLYARIVEAMVDRYLGLAVCILERYRLIPDPGPIVGTPEGDRIVTDSGAFLAVL